MSAKDNTLDHIANVSLVNHYGTLIVCNVWWENEGTMKSVCVSLHCAFSATNLIQKEQKSITVWFCFSRWTGFPKSGRREQRFPPTLSPCWITSPQTCTPCLSSVLPSLLWTARAALHALTLRASTSPSTGRWVHVDTSHFKTGWWKCLCKAKCQIAVERVRVTILKKMNPFLKQSNSVVSCFTALMAWL